MIYKSRNGIGTRVILITLFFFFMLTDAESTWRERNETAQQCATSVYLGHSGNTKDINPNLDGEMIQQKIKHALENSIKKTEKKAEKQKKVRTICIYFAFFFVFVIIMCIGAIYFKHKIIKPTTIGMPTTTAYHHVTCISELHSIGYIWDCVIIGVACILFLICAVRACTLTAEMTECNNLIDLLEDEKNRHILLIEELEWKTVQFMEDQKAKQAKEGGIVEKFEEMKEYEALKEKKFKEFEEEEFLRKKKFKEFETEEAVRKTTFEEMKEKEVVREAKFKEIGNKEILREKEVEKEKKVFIKKEKSSTKSAIKEETSREKKVEKEECLFDNIDVNLFIYAMVFVFALFAICTICNFKEEKETREIIEV